jgi:catechol 2,3-dioxygenase-like lactoylglutathione lyase family enzyme
MEGASTTQVAQGLRGLVPMAHVADVKQSVAFYERLGFKLINSVREADTLNWAYLKSEGAELMLARSSRPLNPGAQDCLFYLYAEDVKEYRQQLLALGISAGEIKFPFWSPRGEFSVDDPDGYTLMVSHAD